MNILFFCEHPIVATDGGISRITDSLVSVFRNYGHCVFILSAKKQVNAIVDEKQVYLPNDLYDEKSLIFASNFCKKNKINLIVNQNAANVSVVNFFERLKELADISIYSCMHNCTETPILNYAYQKEFLLRQRHLTFFYYLLKTNIVKNLIRWLYIWKYKKLYTKVAEISDYVLVLNDKLVEEFKIFVSKRYYSKIKVVPNCLPLREWNNKCCKEKILLWVGRVDVSVKRIDLMLNAWKLIYKLNMGWKLYVLGDGPYIEFAKNFVLSNNLKNVFFEGRVNPYPYYEKASMLAVTSSHESFSLVTLEALQHKVVPVVMNSFPFASSLIQSGVNGVLINKFDYNSLADSLNSLMKDDALLSKMSKTCVESAARFSPELVYRDYWSKILVG